MNSLKMMAGFSSGVVAAAVIAFTRAGEATQTTSNSAETLDNTAASTSPATEDNRD